MNKGCCPDGWVCCDQGPAGIAGTNIRKDIPFPEGLDPPPPGLGFGGPGCYPPGTVCCPDGHACGDRILDVRCCAPTGVDPAPPGSERPTAQYNCWNVNAPYPDHFPGPLICP